MDPVLCDVDTWHGVVLLSVHRYRLAGGHRVASMLYMYMGAL
jgi:hypothetical protein